MFGQKSRYFELAKVIVSPRRNITFKTRNPREPHFERKKMLEVCKPIFDPPLKPAWETCGYNSVLPFPIEAHPYEKILAKELKNNWYSSRMICFFHVNSMGLEEEKKIRNTFLKKDMFFHIYSESVAKLVLDNTPFVSCLHLMKCETAFVFSSEPKASVVLDLSKKITHVVLLAALIDNVFLSKIQLQNYSRLTNVEALHAQLSHLLNTKTAHIAQTIDHPTRILSQNLTQLSEAENA